MSLIMGQIEPEHPDLFALEFVNIAEYGCLHFIINKYEPISTKLHQLYVIIRSWMSSIMDLIGPELSELSALELENFTYLNLFKI